MPSRRVHWRYAVAVAVVASVASATLTAPGVAAPAANTPAKCATQSSDVAAITGRHVSVRGGANVGTVSLMCIYDTGVRSDQNEFQIWYDLVSGSSAQYRAALSRASPRAHPTTRDLPQLGHGAFIQRVEVKGIRQWSLIAQGKDPGTVDEVLLQVGSSVALGDSAATRMTIAVRSLFHRT